MWKTFGHERVKRLLDRQLEADVFAHAYAFIGPGMIGKKMLAEEFARKLLAHEQLSTHPDYIFFDADENGTVAGIRGIIDRLAARPIIGARTIAVIDNAEQLSPEAMNALLKTLEEPKPHAIIMLISQDRMIATVLSRCQVLHCYQATNAQLQNFAHSEKLNVSDSIYALTSGSIGLLTTLLADPDRATELATSVQTFQRALDGSRADKLIAIQTFAEREPVELRELLRCVLAAQKEKPARAHTLIESIDLLNKTVNKKHALALALQAYGVS
jgi:DNA polymerase III delta prime subunit